MKRVVIIDRTQFAYHTGNYYNCKYLKGDYNIVYICWDHDFPKIEMSGVKVIYVSRKGGFIVRSIRFIRRALNEVTDNTAIVFIKYFKIVSLALRLCKSRHIFVLDIRTGSVYTHPLRRLIDDARLRFETVFFNHITIISKSLAKKLNILKKSHILPLGADIISTTNKNFDRLDLLYVGTLYNRKIENTIHGFKKFYDQFNSQIPLSYSIIGSGPNNEEIPLKQLVSHYGLTGVITVTGQIPYTELEPYFANCNIGVSYIPMTDYYDVQPATKTFEYLLSGMPVIATRTSENMKTVNAMNGVLINEGIDDFYHGLTQVVALKNSFDSEKIRRFTLNHTWKNIVLNNLKVYFENLPIRA